MPAIVKASTHRQLKRPPVQKSSREPLAAIAHDARNVLMALRLFCDLLAEPGVLSPGHEYFAEELQMVAGASAHLVEQLAGLKLPLRPISLDEANLPVMTDGKAPSQGRYIEDLAVAVEGLAGPLELLAGKAIDFEVECLPCPGRVLLSKEDLTRILINFTRNAAEAMPQGGRIRVTLQQGDGGSFFSRGMLSGDPSCYLPQTALLCVQDNGPGIPSENIERIFETGFSTKQDGQGHHGDHHRGHGLSIVRHLAEAAGGCVRAGAAPSGGARFEVELPLIDRRGLEHRFLTDFPERSYIEC